MFNKKIHPSDSCQQKNIRKWPKTTLHGVRSNKNLTSSPRFHQLRSLEPTFGLGQCREHNLLDGQFFCVVTIRPHLETNARHRHTNIFKHHIQKHLPNTRHPRFFALTKPNPSNLTDQCCWAVVSWRKQRLLIFSVSMKNASFIKHQWLENLQAAGTSLPTGRSQGQMPPKEGHSIQHTCFYLPSSWVDIGGNYPTMSYHRKRGTALYNWACQFLCKSISACEIIIFGSTFVVEDT